MSGNGQKKPVVYLDACFVSHWAGQDLDYHERVSREIDEKGPDAFIRERLAARRREREAGDSGAMMVREDAPEYGAETRKGAGGE